MVSNQPAKSIKPGGSIQSLEKEKPVGLNPAAKEFIPSSRGSYNFEKAMDDQPY